MTGKRLQTVNKYLLRLSHNVPSKIVNAEKQIAKNVLAHPSEHSAEERQAAALIVHPDRRVASKEMMGKAVRGDMSLLAEVENSATVGAHHYSLGHDQFGGARQALKKTEAEFNPKPKPEPKHWAPAKRYSTDHSEWQQPATGNSWRPGAPGWKAPGQEEKKQAIDAHQAWRSKAVTKSSSSSIPIQPVVPLGSSGSMMTLTGGGHITADEHNPAPGSISPEPQPPTADQSPAQSTADPNSADESAPPPPPAPVNDIAIPSPTEANDPFGN